MIDNFHGDYMFLSNFYACDIEYEGIKYPSTEHAYQAAKTLDENERRKIAASTTAGQAKKAGKMLKLREDWAQVKLKVMEDILRIKFSNPELRKKLNATKPEELIEGNWWGDKYWGMVKSTPQSDWEGSNHLGKILMKIRDEE